VKYLNETNSTTLNYSATTTNGSHFMYLEDRDPSGTGVPVLAPGDLAIITIDLSDTNQELNVRSKGTVQIIPETGTMIVKDIVAPASFGTYTNVQLFP
jgi:archaellin